MDKKERKSDTFTSWSVLYRDRPAQCEGSELSAALTTLETGALDLATEQAAAGSQLPFQSQAW